MELGDERGPQRLTSLVDGAMTDVTLLVAGERLAHSVHLPANSRELRQYGVGDAIELLATLGFDRGIADLLKVSEGRIDHARTRGVETLGRFFKRLDDLVPMSRAFLEQRQNNQLELAGAQLAPSKETPTDEPCAVAARR